jgi:predicted Zn-dependent peptidase
LIVRDRLGLAYGIQSSLTYFKEGAFFSIASATATPNTGKLLEETIHQLRLLKAADVLAEEVETSKDYLIGGYPLSVSTLGAVASRWMNGYSYQLGPDYMNEFMPKISAVTRESVVQAVDEAFHLDQLVVVVAGDAKTIEKSLREKGFKRFRRIPVKSLL